MSVLNTRVYTLIKCPLPGCDEDLHVWWEHIAALYLVDLDDGKPISPEAGTDVSTWKVGCEAGHVVLVPGDPGCDCDDDCECDVDRSDEVRTFRASDLKRLAALVGES